VKRRERERESNPKREKTRKHNTEEKHWRRRRGRKKRGYLYRERIIERGSMREGMRGKEGGWWRGKKWVLDGRSHRFHLLVVL